MSSLEHIERERVGDLVLNQLFNLLENGAMQPGDRLPSEQQLMEQLGVSRPPIREALNTLIGMGIVEKRHGSGYYLRRVDLAGFLTSPTTSFLDMRQQIVEVVEARMLLEVEIIALVVREATDDELQLLRDLLQALRVKVESNTLAIGDSLEFHRLLARLTKNSVLSQLVEFLIGLALQHERGWLFGPFDPKVVLQRHEELMAVIEQRDEQAARQLMRVHLLNSLGRAKALEKNR